MSSKRPLYVARRGYRHRRATDAARLLPICGAFFYFLPILWGGGQTRRGVIYVFAVWLVLIVAAGLLSRLLRRTSDADDLDKNATEQVDGTV